MTRTRGAAYVLALGYMLGAACGEAWSKREPSSLATACRDSDQCQDGLACNGAEVCEAGRCVAGAAPSCDDGDRCTLDGCNEGSGCVHIAVEATCDGAATAALDAALPHDAANIDATLVEPMLVDGAVVDGAAAPGLAPPSDLSRPPDVLCPTSVPAINVQSNAAVQAYRDVVCCAGAVYIGSDVTDLSPLAQLRRAGSLEHRAPAAVLSALRALERVDGAIYMQAEDRSTGPLLPALRYVGGDLRIVGVHSSNQPFPLLSYVAGNLGLSSGKESSSAAPVFPALVTVGGTIQHDNGLSVAARFPALTSVAGLLLLDDDAVALDSLTALRFAGGIAMVGSSALSELSLPVLERANQIMISGNPALSALHLPKLAYANRVEIRLNPRLSRCQVDSLIAQVQRDLTSQALVCCNAGCEVCTAARCEKPGAVSAGQSTTLAKGSFRSDFLPAAYTSVEHADVLEFDQHGAEPMPTFALRNVGTLAIDGASAWTSLVGFSALQRVESLQLTQSGFITLAGLEHVEHIGKLGLTYNRALRDISALDPAHGDLRSFTGNLWITDNPLLPQCEAERLAAALAPLTDGGISVQRNGPCGDAGVDAGP